MVGAKDGASVVGAEVGIAVFPRSGGLFTVTPMSVATKAMRPNKIAAILLSK